MDLPTLGDWVTPSSILRGFLSPAEIVICLVQQTLKKLLLLVASAVLVFAADSSRYREDFHYSYPQTAAGRLSIENFNGSVEITGWRKGLCWTDMEIRNHPNGKPVVLLCGAAKEVAEALRVSDILLSISHCRAYATAHAVAVSGTGDTVNTNRTAGLCA